MGVDVSISALLLDVRGSVWKNPLSVSHLKLFLAYLSSHEGMKGNSPSALESFY